jgi:N6-adenosine-specific RNA methylase IME4
LLTWAKDRAGTGPWLRGQTEHCLLFTRGKPVFLSGGHSTLLSAKVREHSRKPDEFYALVEATCPGSKLELFARERRAGWQVWGAEPDRFPAQAEEAA